MEGWKRRRITAKEKMVRAEEKRKKRMEAKVRKKAERLKKKMEKYERKTEKRRSERSINILMKERNMKKSRQDVRCQRRQAGRKKGAKMQGSRV